MISNVPTKPGVKKAIRMELSLATGFVSICKRERERGGEYVTNARRAALLA